MNLFTGFTIKELYPAFFLIAITGSLLLFGLALSKDPSLKRGEVIWWTYFGFNMFLLLLVCLLF